MNSAIVGIGETDYVRGAGKTTMRLAAEAAIAAIRDAGITPLDVDGIMIFWHTEPLMSRDVAKNLGIVPVNWQLDVKGGGENGPGVIATAAAAIDCNLCHTVLCLHAGNRFSAKPSRSSGPNFTAPFGLSIAPQSSALLARRHMYEYGTTAEQFGEVAIAFREHAGRNPRALMQKPITMDEYLGSRMISSPFRLLDCCLETDGAAACIVTSMDRAVDMRHRPVQILAGVANASGAAGAEGRTSDEYTSMGSRHAAPLIWDRARVGPNDMNLAQIYDCFTFTVIAQLEDYGFCKKGEGGPFVEGGRLTMSGSLPTNTSGGHLSEGYVKSMNLVNEGVRQLRHEYDGTVRQVKDAELTIVTGAPGTGSAIVLARK